MNDDGEESPGGAAWLAPESEREDRQSEPIDRVHIFASSSHARPVSQLLGSLSLSHDADAEGGAEMIHGRSISFADGLASLAVASSEASPARTAAAGASTSSCCSPNNKNHQQHSWQGFADVCGSPALSSGGDNWVEAIDRAIAEMVS